MNSGVRWQKAAKLLLLYGLTVPLFTGFVFGSEISAIVRDIVPFFFLLLPLFITPLFEGREEKIKLLTYFVVLGGFVFSARVLLPYVLEAPATIDPFLLANAPTVLFAALFLLGCCGLSLCRAIPPPYALKGALFFALSLVPIVTMALITQRASMGIVVMMVAIMLATGIVKKPLRVFVPLCLLLSVIFVYWVPVTDLIQDLMRKTSLVGFNMRWQEALAVFEEIGGSFLTVLFGKGWGANIASPAVGGAVVNFTHSLLTTYWLKTGLAGLCLVLLYLYQLGLLLFRLLFRHPVMAMALAGPFAIDVLLYASFKSLDFGLLLLLIPLWGTGKKLDQR